MSENKFEVGQRVVLLSGSDLETHNEYEDDCTRGVVKSIDEDGKVLVKWDDSYRNRNRNRKTDKHNADELITEVVADEILSKLEAEFEAWAGPIREKLKQAGALLKEADELADKHGRDLTQMCKLTGPLTSAMDEVGWRTSSLTC